MAKMKHSDKAADAKMVKAAVHKHEKAMHPGKKPTKLKGGGSVTNEAMLKYGRNMARAKNQGA